MASNDRTSGTETTGTDSSDSNWDNATDFATADTTLTEEDDAYAASGQATDGDLDDAVTRGGGAKSFMHTITINDQREDTFNDASVDLAGARDADVGTATAGGNTGIRGDTDPNLAAVMDRNEVDRLGDGGYIPGDSADDPEVAYNPPS